MNLLNRFTRAIAPECGKIMTRARRLRKIPFFRFKVIRTLTKITSKTEGGAELLRVRKKSTFSRQELRDKIDATPALYKRPGFGTEPNTYSPFAMRASFHLLAEIGLFSCPELLRVSEGKMESNVTSRLYRLPIEVSLN